MIPFQDRVYNEIIEVLGPDEPVSSEQLKKLHYLDIVYKETLRCLSIAAMIQRTVEEEITISGGVYSVRILSVTTYAYKKNILISYDTHLFNCQ